MIIYVIRVKGVTLRERFAARNLKIRKEFTKETKKAKASIMTIPFNSVYKLRERSPKSFSKIKLFPKERSLLRTLVPEIEEEVNRKYPNLR